MISALIILRRRHTGSSSTGADQSSFRTLRYQEARIPELMPEIPRELVVVNSRISDNTEHGITCMQSSAVSVNNSTLSGNKGSGIALSSSSTFSLNHNWIGGNLQAGLLLLDASYGIVHDNLFNNTGNVKFVSGSSPLRWNTTLTQGRNIVNGPILGWEFLG